jgi:hypothetical protein
MPYEPHRQTLILRAEGGSIFYIGNQISHAMETFGWKAKGERSFRSSYSSLLVPFGANKGGNNKKKKYNEENNRIVD